MMKTIAAGIWVVVVVLGSAYGAATWKQASDQHAAEEKPATPMETVKVKAVIVPILGDGTVQHYIRAQVAFTIEKQALKTLSIAPEPFVVDETFRAIFAAGRDRFASEGAQKLDWLVKAVLDGTNAHYPEPVIKNILIQELVFLGKTEVRSKEH